MDVPLYPIRLRASVTKGYRGAGVSVGPRMGRRVGPPPPALYTMHTCRVYSLKVMHRTLILVALRA